MILIGEVQTGLVGHSVALPAIVAKQLVDIRSGQQVTQHERPVRLAISADVLTGVDCHLPASKQIRAVGTVASRVILTDGLVLQASSRTQVKSSEGNRRLSWSHYLGQPGTVETISGGRATSAIAGHFLDSQGSQRTLDLAAINRRLQVQVQRNGELDLQNQFRLAPTQMRWIAFPSAGEPVLEVDGGKRRTIQLPVPEALWDSVSADDLVTLAEEIAGHEWLLTVLLVLLDRSQIGTPSRRKVAARLAPLMDFLFHLWNPVTRVHPALRPVWQSIDETAGLTSQWQTGKERVRDQISLASLSH